MTTTYVKKSALKIINATTNDGMDNTGAKLYIGRAVYGDPDNPEEIKTHTVVLDDKGNKDLGRLCWTLTHVSNRKDKLQELYLYPYDKKAPISDIKIVHLCQIYKMAKTYYETYKEVGYFNEDKYQEAIKARDIKNEQIKKDFDYDEAQYSEFLVR